MDFTELTKILSDDGIHVCPICGTPFEPYHSRQKTCGAEDCKREFHNQYVQARVKRLKAENPEAWRQYHANANRKWRHKQRNLKKRDKELKKLQEQWERQAEFEKKIEEYGHEYGKRSAEKVLAMVPKIDVNLKGARNDRVDSKDNAE